MQKKVVVSDLENKKKQHGLKIKQLIADLNSGNATKISSALKSLQVNGDITVIRPLVELLKTDLSHQLETEILDFLGDIKVTMASSEFIAVLRDENFVGQRQQVLSTIWNSKIDYSEYIAEFVEIACEGNFMEALECLTIIENLDGPFEENHILECQLHLRDYIEDSTPKDPQKTQIMSEIAVLIKEFDLSIDDFDD